MRALLEGGLFLTAAAGLHLLALSVVTAPDGAAGASGDDGTERLTLAAASASLSALVQAWETPPDVTPVILAPKPPAQSDTPLPRPVTDRPPLPTADGPALPMPQDAAQDPVLDTAPATPQPRPAPAHAEQKPAEPPKPKPRPTSDSSAGQKAAGTGQTAAAGQNRAGSASLSAGQARSLTAQWAGQILTRIERRKRYPSVARGRDGVVGLRLTLGADGMLRGVSITRSAGNAALDRAALQAVQRVGRFPPAPKGLSGPSFSFDLKIRFDG